MLSLSFNKVANVGTAKLLLEFQVSGNIRVTKNNLFYCLIALKDKHAMPFNLCTDSLMIIYFHLFDRQEHFHV